MRIDNANLQGTVNLNKQITDIKSSGHAGMMVMVDGVLHIIRGNGTPIGTWYGGTGPDYGGPAGVAGMFEIPLPIAETGSIADFGTYASSAYILFSNGNLYVTGNNLFGQLGLGDLLARGTYVLTNTNVTKVFTTPSTYSRDINYVRLIIQKTDNKIYGVGYNAFGHLGLGNTTQNITTWTEMTWCGVNPLSVWNMGGYVGCTFCQRADGTIWATGYNGSGQLGNGSTTSISTAINVTSAWAGGLGTGMIIQRLTGGLGYTDNGTSETGNITIFLDNGTTSRIASAGANNWGNLGDTTTTDRSTPVTPTGFSGRVQQLGRIGDSPGSIYVLKTDGTLWTWGFNGDGQLGRGNITSGATPTQVQTGVTQMFNEVHQTYLYGYFSASPIIEKADGYYSAGYNVHSQLGIGTQTSANVFTRMLFPANTRLSRVGSFTTLNQQMSRVAVDTLGNVFMWGSNAHSGLHNGGVNNISVPIKVRIPALLK